MTPERPAALKTPRIPPRWIVRGAWVVHRAIYRITPGRFGLWPAKPGKWGAMRLHTTGRRSGRTRTAILGYFEDGPNVVTLAMNGWDAPEPAWWLNLQGHPVATLDLPDRSLSVRGRAASGEERERLWARWQEHDDDVEGYATLRATETAVVVLEPHAAPPSA